MRGVASINIKLSCFGGGQKTQHFNAFIISKRLFVVCKSTNKIFKSCIY